jgi:hypothetical protein
MDFSVAGLVPFCFITVLLTVVQSSNLDRKVAAPLF